MEIWKDVHRYVGLYQASNYGRIRSMIKNKILSPGDNGRGYKFIHLKHNGSVERFYVHRLIAMTFIPNIYNKKEVNHIDFDKDNNHVENLEWMTCKENLNHAKINNRFNSSEYQKAQTSKANSGENSYLSKLNDKSVIEIRKLYKGGLTQKQISKIYSVNRATIGYITSNKTWKHV